MTPASATLPIASLVDAHPARRPEWVTLEGRWVTLAPLDASKHAEALYIRPNRRAARTYPFDGP